MTNDFATKLSLVQQAGNARGRSQMLTSRQQLCTPCLGLSKDSVPIWVWGSILAAHVYGHFYWDRADDTEHPFNEHKNAQQSERTRVQQMLV